MNAIREALAQMDPLDDDQWTSDGAPKVDVVKDLLGDDVTRQQIVDAAPHFNKGNPELDDEPEKPEVQEEDAGDEDIDHEKIAQYLDQDPLTQEEFRDYLKDVPIGTLEALRDTLQLQLKSADEAVNTAQEMQRRIKIALSFTSVRLSTEKPDKTNAEALRDFIKSQQEQRAKRFDFTRQVASQIDINSLDPRAPIDRALGKKRKTGR
jgi:hypothetical protein